jgi:hypothetical protein
VDILELNPDHVPASEYLALTQNKLRSAAQKEVEERATLPCIVMDVHAAMLRVKSTVQPEFPVTLRRSLSTSPHTVSVEARIEQNGDVTVLKVRGENEAINKAVLGAVGRWKFSPAIVESEPRCVETVFPIVVTSPGPD